MMKEGGVYKSAFRYAASFVQGQEVNIRQEDTGSKMSGTNMMQERENTLQNGTIVRKKSTPISALAHKLRTPQLTA